MRSYHSWLIERQIHLINSILVEAVSDCSIPETKLKKQFTSDEVVEILKSTYLFEKDKQAQLGKDIRNPAMVVVNKLRHELVAYDDIRDAITKCYRENKISYCEKLQLEMNLQLPLKRLVDDTIDMIKAEEFPMDLAPRETIMNKDVLFDANQAYKDGEMNGFLKDFYRFDCKNKLAGTTAPIGPRPVGTPMSQRFGGARKLGGTGPMSPPPEGYRMDKD